MTRFEKELIDNRPDLILVVGDVTSTMACTIAAKKLCIDAVHVEAGIRSGDMTMPEEINRIVTDSITDHFFTTSEVANDHLRRAGVGDDRIHFVGNTMIDTLYQNLERLIEPEIWSESGLEAGNYFLLTLHRPANVDSPANLQHLLKTIMETTGSQKVVFPVHPRTKKILDGIGFNDLAFCSVQRYGRCHFTMGVITPVNRQDTGNPIPQLHHGVYRIIYTARKN